MKLMKRYSGVLLLLICLLSLGPNGTAFQCKKVSTNEFSIRSRATKIVRPEFPDAAWKSGAQGVAVCALELNESGSVVDVRVLEAPHPQIGEAVIKAVKQWKFKSMLGEQYFGQFFDGKSPANQQFFARFLNYLQVSPAS